MSVTKDTHRIVEHVLTRVVREGSTVPVIVTVTDVRATKAGYSARVVVARKMHQRVYRGRINSKTLAVKVTPTGDVEPRTVWA